MHLTEEEFEKAVQFVATLGQMTNDKHNEVVLMSGSLGFSSLICLLNNGNNGPDRDHRQSARAVLAHEFAAHGERRLDRALADAGPGAVRQLHAASDQSGKPIEGAEVDVWHSSPEGFYEQQDPKQAP